MTECAECGTEVQLPFQCSFCGNYYCMEHRLPENHKCHETPPRTPLGSYYAKQRSVEKTATKTGVMESEGELHFVKKRPLGLKRRRRFPRMRLWYWFLLFLFVAALVLFLVGNYYFYVVGSENFVSKDTQFGWELMLYSALLLLF